MIISEKRKTKVPVTILLLMTFGCFRVMAITVVTMFTLAAVETGIGRAPDNPALRTKRRVTMIDGNHAASGLLGLALNAARCWR